MVKLSSRLSAVASQITAGSRLADIGSDHALLPVFLVQHNVAAFAVAGEVNAGPYEAAGRQVQEAGLSNRIDVRHGDGLMVIQPGEVDTITIAGMGGALIVAILSADPMRLDGVKRLVLQPNVGEEFVRKWLYANQWSLIEEQIIEEDGKIYEIITAIKETQMSRGQLELYAEGQQLAGGTAISRELLFAFGPLLIRYRSPVLVRKWKLELGKLRRICADMGQSDLAATRAKETEIRERIAAIEGVVRCLQTDSK